MKIIVATPLYPPEGERIAVYSRQLAKNLGAKHQVTVLTYGYKIEPINNLQVVVIDKTKPLPIRLFNYAKSLLALAKSHDLIYVQNAGAIGLPAILVKYLSRKPVIINFFEDEAFKRAFHQSLTDQPLEVFLKHPPANAKIKRIIKVQGWVLRHASLITVSSEYLAKLLSENYKVSPEKIVVNHLAEDREEKLPLPVLKNRHQILASGPLLDSSGLDKIIQAVAKLKEKFADIQLIITGQGQKKKQLMGLVQKLKLDSNVKFLGRVSQAENWYLLKTSSVYVHNFSGWDQNDQITRSLLAKTSVLAQDNVLNQEILSKNSSGLLFSATKPEDLVSQLDKILTVESLGEGLTVRASQNLVDNFSWEFHLNNLNSIFSSLLKK
ncbi:MAG: hypothetical protein A2406_00435 [Candidatus Komeilibacteria bacterium RIFOXYC1_FULL_37_11]|uniref:Glycosyltransferase subfamily 4-like N-terminal domain-containing protein n=1 Tax=Candidatus Komeilibacteria bacterium RIFOXYC1_FULL_37_11 TaxID=1798555 RepID=A0A1G2BX96_9BACT|nr:MAG: hypothetical protein A2406_00435 [Candidatus Komeilibacteria bacterium RIFOXYC1_FULL_37_11]OGY95963.1 MAG: hypothetical protein A2611_04045 [Candidatus Komeilibacteria bacterium RIFOXYD1_FULL_37_29]